MWRLLLVALVVLVFPGPAPGRTEPPQCPAHRLHADVGLQGATGSMLGGLGLSNTGTRTCVVRGPVRLLLLDRSGTRLPLAQVARRGFFGDGDRDVRLAPGQRVGAMLQLWNACWTPPGARLWVVLARGEGRVDLRIGPAGRCDAPSNPPAYSVGGFVPADPVAGPPRR